MSKTSIVVCVVAVLMVACGIILIFPYDSATAFNPMDVLMQQGRLLAAAFFFALVIGTVFTKRLFLGFMLAIATPILFFGCLLFLNGLLDSNEPEYWELSIVNKYKRFDDGGNRGPGHWIYSLEAIDEQGRTWTVHTSNSGGESISEQDWHYVQLEKGRYELHLIHHKGAFAVPWNKIAGVVRVE